MLPNGDVVGCTTSRVITSLRKMTVEQVLATSEFRRNAAAGPRCKRRCRDWGIFDVSALHNAEFGLTDLRQYDRTFLRGPLGAGTRASA